MSTVYPSLSPLVLLFQQISLWNPGNLIPNKQMGLEGIAQNAVLWSNSSTFSPHIHLFFAFSPVINSDCSWNWSSYIIQGKLATWWHEIWYSEGTTCQKKPWRSWDWFWYALHFGEVTHYILRLLLNLGFVFLFNFFSTDLVFFVVCYTIKSRCWWFCFPSTNLEQFGRWKFASSRISWIHSVHLYNEI